MHIHQTTRPPWARETLESTPTSPIPRIKLPKPSKAKAKKPGVVPEDLTSALRRNKKARASFESFNPSHQREYVEWITEAKSEETRNRRLETAIEWLGPGIGST